MLKEETLLKVLTPETIQNIGNDNIAVIKKLGKENSYLFVEDVTMNPNYNPKGSVQKSKRLTELSNSRLVSNISETGRILFCSELRFPNDSKIISVLKSNKITPEDIIELNKLIQSYQQEQIKYTLEKIKLEKKYNLTPGQVIDIIKLYPSLLNTNVELKDIDLELYKTAKKFYLLLKLMTDNKNKKIKAINDNQTFIKLTSLTKDYFGQLPQDVYLLINKSNELLVINPEYTVSDKQKKLN